MRLIDADVYVDKMRERQEKCEELIETAESNVFLSERDHWQGVFATFVEAKLTLDDTPTVDAVPVRHGKWIDDNCSECGQYVYHGDARNYCPNCGAKMNEERREGI